MPALGIQVELVKENTHQLIDPVHLAMTGKVALPTNDAIMQAI